MKAKVITFVFTLAALSAYGQMPSAEMQLKMFEEYLIGKSIDVELWPEGAPSSNGIDYSKPLSMGTGTMDMKPRLKVMLPKKVDKPTKAVIICPGGGYAAVATFHEGNAWGRFFNRENVAVIVLTYRLPHQHHEVPSSDVYQAIRIVKARAGEWNIDPTQIGVMGSSAGGHLASTVATHADDDVRPAFQILFYPVITMDKQYTSATTHDQLLGRDADKELEEQYSNELHVTEQTPRAFIVLADDDPVVSPLNAIMYYTALKQHHVAATLHIYPSGGHGFGVWPSWKYNGQMLIDLADWLKN